MPDPVFNPQLWSQWVGYEGDGLRIHNTPALWRDLFPVPQSAGHKYSRGHALVCGGGIMTGAARLAARAAQRIGAGIVTLASPAKAVPLYAETLESVIVRSADTLNEWQALLQQVKSDALLIGPGLGTGEQQKAYILSALKVRKPTVLDADVFTNFAQNPEELLSLLHAECVLTPHEGEFKRFFGMFMEGVTDKVSRARKASALTQSVILLKGAETVIAHPEGMVVINNNAPPWLATAGAGDVLAGMILGLITQKMPVFPASAAAAWLHGYIATSFGLGLIAEDLVAGIPKALQDLLPLP